MTKIEEESDKKVIEKPNVDADRELKSQMKKYQKNKLIIDARANQFTYIDTVKQRFKDN